LRNIKLTLQYDGTAYHGFQRQDPRPTIQAELEKALVTITGEPVRLVGAGRTDAGVHALGQVVSFKTTARIPTERWPAALNSLLPPDIVVLTAEEVALDFHARKSARRKTYRYVVANAPLPSAFLRNYAYLVRERLDLEAMQTAARFFLGRHDFAAFRATGSSVKTSERTIYRLELRRQPFEVLPWFWLAEAANPKLDQEGQDLQPTLLHFIVEADGFLYNMVRIIVGTLLEVGRGRFQPGDVGAILLSKDRARAGPTVPARGLFLERVEY